MLKLLLRSALFGAAGYGVICAAMFAMQRSLEFQPDTSKPDVQRAGLPALREVTVQTAPGLRLLAWYLPAAAGQPVVAYFHGNGGNLANRIGRLKLFGSVGWGVLMVEYPGFGGNPGHPSEKGFASAAEAAMAFIEGQGFAGRRVVVYGESIGTGVATRVAAEREVGALVLEAPFTSAAAIAQRRFWWLPVRWLMLDQFDQVSRIGRVRAPILILQGERDPVVPPDLGLALFDAAPEPKRLWVAPDGGHDDLMALGAFQRIEAFVTEALLGAAMVPASAVEVAAPAP